MDLGEELSTTDLDFDEVTDTVFAKTVSGRTVMIRLNVALADSVIYELDYSSKKSSVGWGWYHLPDSNEVVILPKFQGLIVSANIPDDSFKADYRLALSIIG